MHCPAGAGHVVAGRKRLLDEGKTQGAEVIRGGVVFEREIRRMEKVHAGPSESLLNLVTILEARVGGRHTEARRIFLGQGAAQEERCVPGSDIENNLHSSSDHARHPPDMGSHDRE